MPTSFAIISLNAHGMEVAFSPTLCNSLSYLPPPHCLGIKIWQWDRSVCTSVLKVHDIWWLKRVIGLLEPLHFCEWQGITCGSRKHPQRVISLRLAGLISSAVSNLTFLKAIDLSNNLFHGPIPQELGRLSRLLHLNLSVNALEGGIPETLSSFFQIRYISMRSNMLASVILPGLSNCSDLRLIDLLSNNLAGHIPPALTNLTFLTYIGLAYNNFSCSIPLVLWTSTL